MLTKTPYKLTDKIEINNKIMTIKTAIENWPFMIRKKFDKSPRDFDIECKVYLELIDS